MNSTVDVPLVQHFCHCFLLLYLVQFMQALPDRRLSTLHECSNGATWSAACHKGPSTAVEKSVHG